MCSIYKTHAKHRSLHLLAMSLILSCVFHANSNEYRRLSQEVIISTHRNISHKLFKRYYDIFFMSTMRISLIICEEYRFGIRSVDFAARMNIAASISWISWPMSFSSSRRMWFREPKMYWSRNMSQLTRHRGARISASHLCCSKLTNFLSDYQIKWFSWSIRDCTRNITLKKLTSNIQKQFFREFKVSFY